jgi:hypothetical protein
VCFDLQIEVGPEAQTALATGVGTNAVSGDAKVGIAIFE